MRIRQRLPRRRRRDDGFAIVYVMAAGMIASLLVTMVIGITVTSNKASRNGQDYQAAMAAAQAGVDDYLSRLNNSNTYWQSTDCTNKAIPKPGTCGGASTAVGWQPVAGSTTPTGVACSTTPTPVDCPRFHYDVDASATPANGRIIITSTGRSRNETRTVRTTLSTAGFNEFLYYSDIESTDPSNAAAYGDYVSWAQTNCPRHYWDSPARNSSCRDITFISGDTIDGPLHTNDTLLISGNPLFKDTVTTGYPNCQSSPPQSKCYRPNGSASPQFQQGIRYAPTIDLPPTNTGLKRQVTPGTSNGSPGCLFTGPTRIVFNANGTMNVWSPFTTTGINSGCGGTTPNGINIPVPADNVIYVQNVPSGQTTNPSSGACPAGKVGGLPTNGDDNVKYGDWDCRSGIALVEGTLKGRVTVAAENNIMVTNNLTYSSGTSDSGTDSLGLIAANSVMVYHPIDCTRTASGVCSDGTNRTGTMTDVTIHAAILSLQHSFTVESYQIGAQLGTLTVFGSISQKYRGPVGTFNGDRTGYTKNYSYDDKLRFAPPPYYLDPVSASYRQGAFAEVAPLYR